MTTTSTAPSYKGFRFPQEIIAHAVWLYHRFNLSVRDVEELLATRGVIVTYETVRQWCKKFGQQFANQLRRRRAQPGVKRRLEFAPNVNWNFPSRQRPMLVRTCQALPPTSTTTADDNEHHDDNERQ